MKTRARGISGGKVSARNTENVDSLMVVDGTEIPGDPANQVAVELNLEIAIAKLKDGQRQALANLHEEIDQLKRQNQGLQILIAFNDGQVLGRNATSDSHTRHQTGKLTSSRAAGETHRVHSERTVTPRASDDLQPAQTTSRNQETTLAASAAEVSQASASLEGRIGELRIKLKEEKCHNITLMNQLAAENARKMSHDIGEILTKRHARTLNLSIRKSSKKPDTKRSCPLPFDATLDPFLVHNERSPTTEECEAIIKALKERVDKQTTEITDIRTDLKDVIETHKLTPESFLLAKYYAQETNTCSSIVKCSCNQRKSSGRQPTIVSLPAPGQLPTQRRDHRLRKSGFLFRHITCSPLVI